MAEEKERKNASISGAGKLSGGVYDTVKVAGSGKIEGDVDANQISTAGACKIEGNVKTKRMETAGSCKVLGDIEAEELEIAGSCSIEGKVQVDLFKSSGSGSVLKSVIAKDVELAGACKVGGDVEADRFTSHGSINIGRLLSADEIQIKLGGRSKVPEIGGERIEVRRYGKGWRSIINFGGWGLGSLETQTIEGDEIYLEATKAKVVRGKKVTIGEDCEIDTVEYEESLEVHESSTVKEKVKI
ncbi:MAG: polymer-forming cytoskeletal protein [Candidatus Bipolaricaulia bacterium]